ncbi:MAG TPA: MFS transporter [Mycobacteriales bacterium]
MSLIENPPRPSSLTPRTTVRAVAPASTSARTTHPPAHTTTSGRNLTRWILVGLVILAAANLRPAVISISPFLGDITAGLGISAAAAGLLTALPVLCFAVFGAVAPAIARRFGARLTVGGAMVVAAVSVAARSLTHDATVFFLLSAIVLACLALGNVILPALVRLRFPNRIGPVTGLFSMGMGLGVAGAAAVTVPAAHLLGQGWRTGLGIWAVAALMVAIPWLVLWPSGNRFRQPDAVRQRCRVYASPTAWAIALFFGTQSASAYAIMGWMPQIYRDAGLTATHAGLLLALTTGLCIPISLVLPSVVIRLRHQGLLVVGLTTFIGLGYAGLAFAPAHLPWLWALLIGMGNGGCFPVTLTMISIRARFAGNTAALSGFVQSTGYLISAIGPLTAGLLYEMAHNWYLPIAMLSTFLVAQGVTGYLAGRPRFFEDDLVTPAPATVDTRR